MMRTTLSTMLAGLLLTACASLPAGTSAPIGADPPLSEATPGPEAPSDPAALESTLVWEPCEAPFECSTLAVPVAHAVPDGPTIELALIRLPAPAAARRVGSLVVNPGGPGGSGVDFVRYGGVETIPAEVRARFDIVGFDPRGVGDSAPLSCGLPPSALLAGDLSPDTADEVDAVMAHASTFADACAANAGDLLPRMATDAVVQDLDLLRAALGDRQLTYLGYSYGTLIGGRYAERFPGTVRALVLDGAVDPALDAVGRARESAARLEEALAAFATECDAEPACAGPWGGATAMVVDDILASLESSPLPAPALGPDRTLGPGEATLAIATLVTERGARWTLLATALAQALAGDGSLLLAVADGATGDTAEPGTQSWLDPLLAVNCLDAPVPAPDALVADAAALQATLPHFGALEMYLHAACAFWPVPPQGAVRPFDAPDAPPILVIGTTGDGVTPYQWSERVADQLGAVLLTRDGETHTAFGDGNVCTARAVIAYLLDLVRPEPGRVCG